MNDKNVMLAVLFGSFLVGIHGICTAQSDDAAYGPPTKIYVPYEQIRDIFEKTAQGVFLPYDEFQQLWRAAQGQPAGVAEAAPYPYLISTARFTGKIEGDLAALGLELTVDILADGWVQVPLGLKEVAVSQAEFLESGSDQSKPLLRVVDGQYLLMCREPGRYVLSVDFKRQLETQPGLHVLHYQLPGATITTLDMLIPEENMNVDVKPMVAASTSQIEFKGEKATRLQAFLGNVPDVHLSWKPRTETAEGLEPVLLCEQFQYIHVGEALLRYEVDLNYTIRRSGVKSFSVQLPGGFRVTEVEGTNIAKWDIENNTADRSEETGQLLQVRLYSAAKTQYALKVKMERFLQDEKTQVRLTPIVTHQVLRRSGLIGITYSSRRVVHLKELTQLARVETGRLPEKLQKQAGVTAYRFISSDYHGLLVIQTAQPRINVNQHWLLGVENTRLQLRGRIHYNISRAGVFELRLDFPEPWNLNSVGPSDLVDDYQLKTNADQRQLYILLKKEKKDSFHLDISAYTQRKNTVEDVDFVLPLVEERHVQSYQGKLTLLLAEQFQGQLAQLQQFQSIPLSQAKPWANIGNLKAAMGFKFRGIDRSKPAGVRLKIAVKPSQVSAVVHRFINIQPGSIDHEAVVQYRIRYAPVDTFYLQVPGGFADEGVEITGKQIKEKPRIEKLPQSNVDPNAPKDAEAQKWAYYKVVLQSKVMETYQLKVRARRSFIANSEGQANQVIVEPILAAGKLSDQSGTIAIAKDETLAIGEPVIEKLLPADVSSETDLPYKAYRTNASLAFKYTDVPYALSFPVVVQKEAKVFTTIVNGVVVEQVLARDGTLNTRGVYLLATSQGDRLPVKLPPEAQVTAVLLNGNEIPVEMGVSPDERIVRLPPSAGQVSKFVLEISYGLKNAKASALLAPTLPEEIPTQQTLWRLWLPQDDRVIGYDRTFSLLSNTQGQNMLNILAQKQPHQVTFKLPGQGKVLYFVRQGPPGQLSVIAWGNEWFSILIWVVILAIGIAMLKLAGFQRVLIILAVGLLAGIVHLYLPLLVRQTVRVGWFAGFLVILLWGGQWFFVKLPQLRQAWPKRQSAKQAKPATEIAQTSEKSDPSSNESADQNKE